MDRLAVKLTIFQACGALPGAGDRHVAEFFPHFLRPETRWGRDYGVEHTTVEHRAQTYEWEAEQGAERMLEEMLAATVPGT